MFGFAKQSAGDVAFESVLGQGTTFTLYLPLAPDIVLQHDENRSSVEPLKVDACILVVEDNEDVGEFARRALTELGHGSRYVQYARAAIIELKRSPGRYDVVFTDAVMPRRSGIELAKDIAERYPDLRVVLTSGYSDVLAQEGTRGLPLLQKPYSIDELAQILVWAIG